MEAKLKMPAYQKFTQMILGIIALFYILYIGADIIVPIIFSLIIAILLDPVVSYLSKKKINRIVAISISLLLAILIFIALLYFVSSQIVMFSEMFPTLKEKIDTLINEGTKLASQTFNVSTDKINQWITQTKSDALSAAKSLIGPTLISMGGIVVVLFLLPVYIFLILLYKEFFLEFISRLFSKSEHKMVLEIMDESKSLIQNYLIGIIIETGLVAFLNVAGLFILGIEYALLLGVISALLNIIPYIGGIVAMVLIVIIVLATKSPIYVLWVLILFGFVQFLDNNFIMPKIVGSKVKLNEFITIVAVLVGSALWGISGMFLSLPIIAILKVVFDRIDSLKPVGFLFGKNGNS